MIIALVVAVGAVISLWLVGFTKSLAEPVHACGKQVWQTCSSDGECCTSNCAEDYAGMGYCSPHGMCVGESRFYYDSEAFGGLVCRQGIWISANEALCHSNLDCYSEYCKDDFVPAGDADGICEPGENCLCCDADQCTHGDECYDNGERTLPCPLPPCSYPRYKCNNGTWVVCVGGC